MNKKSHKLLYLLTFVIAIFVVQLVYLQDTQSISESSKKKKVAFVELVGLPDLAISTESYASRHRTLSTVFEIYGDDGTLREYSYSSFATSHSAIHNKKREIDEK